MFSTIIDVVSLFINVYNNEETKELTKKSRVADVLENISEILKDTHDKIMINTYPHDNCRVLEILYKELQSIVEPYLSEHEKNMLLNSILDSINVEKLFHQRENKEIMEQLLLSSGDFKALSIILRTK
jgi:hypothetical protein